MGCALPEITVFNGLSNTESIVLGRITLGQVSTADLTAATRITLRLYDGLAALQSTVDSAVNPTAITWATDPAGGQVDFALGALGLPLGSWRGKVTVYSPAMPNGEIFALPGSGDYTLMVRVTSG